MAHMKIIGFKGEKMVSPAMPAAISSRSYIVLVIAIQVYDLLAEKMPNWTNKNWASRLRKRAGFPGFSGEEGHHADFTYNDTEPCMREWLRRLGVPLSTRWSVCTTYHIEVKTTRNDHLVPFRISDNQVELVGSHPRPFFSNTCRGHRQNIEY